MGKLIDLTGCKFGKLSVIGLNKEKSQNVSPYLKYWDCICDCGKTRTVISGCLKQGTVENCGCRGFPPGQIGHPSNLYLVYYEDC